MDNKKSQKKKGKSKSKTVPITRKAAEKASGVRQPPPKRTGKRGIGPALESEESTALATTTGTTGRLRSEEGVGEEEVGLLEGEESGEEQTESEQDPEGELVEEEGEEGSLLAKQPPKPTIVGDRIEAHFLTLSFSKTTQGQRLVALHMTLPLTEEHTQDGLLPEQIGEDWSLMNKNGRTLLHLNGIPGQRVCFFLSSDAPEDDPKLVLPAAKVTNVQLAVVQVKGEGEARKVIRLSFRLQVVVSPDVAAFAEMGFGTNYWIKMEEAQDGLFDD